ncbi:MAG TPA: GTP 3',8-cyclase MoaA [Nitrospiria bacterium]
MQNPSIGQGRKGLFDQFGRHLRSLRLSVTDRCDLRCRYCLPAEGPPLVAREGVLSYEEISRIVRILVRLGIARVRITGGEPLLRRGLPDLVRRLSDLEGISDLSLTTNATRLAPVADILKKSGLNRITISLDTLKPEVYQRITRGGDIQAVLNGISASIGAGLEPLKINTVVLRGINDDELPELAAFAFSIGAEPRFLEAMPLGEVGLDNQAYFVEADVIRKQLETRFPLEELGRSPGSTAREYRVKGGNQVLGIISPVSDRFCSSCDRLRLSARGRLQFCLSHEDGIDLQEALRSGVDDADLGELIRQGVYRKSPGNRFLEEKEPVYQISMSGIGG